MKVVIEGEYLIIRLDDGEGLLYEVINSLTNPFKLIKTLSKEGVKEYETTS